MEGKSNKGSRALLAVIFIFVLCTAAMTVVTMVTQFHMKESVESALNMKTDSGKEDDIVIADEYTIRSTLQISDAYKNGTEDSLNDRDKETLEMAKTVLSDITEDGMTDYEKEKAVYLWLTSEMKPDTGMLTVIPTSGEGSDDPHDVLKNHNAICVGYATTFRLFMQMLDIECKVIHNKDLYHSWNLVKLDDEWYHVDCYSDADNGNFLNFNMNDTAAAQSHDWNHEFFPAATGTKYSYAAMNSIELKNIYVIPKAIRKMFEEKQNVAAFTFKEKIEKEDEPKAAGIVNAVLDYLNGSDNFFVETNWSQNEKGEYVLSVYIINYNDDTPKLDDKTQEKISEAVDKAFSDFQFDGGMSSDYSLSEETVETTKAYE